MVINYYVSLNYSFGIFEEGCTNDLILSPVLNFNIGVLGHVDSGKTSLSKVGNVFLTLKMILVRLLTSNNRSLYCLESSYLMILAFISTEPSISYQGALTPCSIFIY